MNNKFYNNKNDNFYTNKNTSLADWKLIFKEECKKLGIDPNKKSDLALLHDWELGYTPHGVVEVIHYYQNLPKYKPDND